MWCRQFPDKDCGLSAHSCALHPSLKPVQLTHWSVVFTNMKLQLSITKKYKSAKFHLHPKNLWKVQSLVTHLSYPISNILKSFLAWRRIFSKLKWDHERMKVKKKKMRQEMFTPCSKHIEMLRETMDTFKEKERNTIHQDSSLLLSTAQETAHYGELWLWFSICVMMWGRVNAKIFSLFRSLQSCLQLGRWKCLWH